ncbi:MAG TPA: hypothetical protein VFB81_15800 [Myxococcales bacterium]|nr:hypothetical protein [Myxococcales bacterium]
MDWTSWRRHFEANAERPMPIIEAPPLDPEVAEALARSLARFQLGESGEGRIAHEIDQVMLPGIDDDYRQALKRFVREEGRHGAILALMVRALGGQLLSRTWTERLFVHSRRLLGVRFKLQVLLAAEVIGIGFYGMIAGRLPSGPMRSALEQICSDERHHLRFHADFFRAGAAGPFWRLTWWPIGTAAAAVVLWDHRHTVSALGVSRGAAASELFELVRGTAARLRPSHTPSPDEGPPQTAAAALAARAA